MKYLDKKFTHQAITTEEGKYNSAWIFNRDGVVDGRCAGCGKPREQHEPKPCEAKP